MIIYKYFAQAWRYDCCMENNAVSLKGKRVLLSGGSTGIGRAIAQNLTQMGCRVITFARREQQLAEALKDIGSANGEIYGLQADVGNKEDVAKIFKTADALFGGLDILVNNAGIGAGSVLETAEDKIEESLAINLLAYLKLTKESVYRMAEGGHIINIGSLSSKIADRESDLYVAAKAGIEGFSDSLRKKINCQKIKVTLVRMGLVNTNMNVLDTETREQLLAQHFLLNAEDVAEAVIFALTRPANCEVMQIDLKASRQIV